MSMTSKEQLETGRDQSKAIEIIESFHEKLMRLQFCKTTDDAWEIKQELFGMACRYGDARWEEGYQLGHNHGFAFGELSNTIDTSIQAAKGSPMFKAVHKTQ